MTNIQEGKQLKVTARIVANCPYCNDLCEIEDLTNRDFKNENEHCCMKCGNCFCLDVQSS